MKKRHIIRALAAAGAAVILTGTVSAYTPYESYTYSTATGSAQYVYSPAPYIPEALYDGDAVGAVLSKPADFSFGPDGNLYIIDSGLNKLVVLDKSYRFLHEIITFQNDGAEDTFQAPSGFFVTPDGDIYICDTGNSRIVLLGPDGALKKLYGMPKTPILTKKYLFYPLKLTVDEAGTMYVINKDEYNGLMKISPQGEFISFIGSNKAIQNPLLKIWRHIFSETQLSQVEQNIPVEYRNLSMDSEGFIFAVSAAKSEEAPVKRLNLSGDDILVQSGYVPVIGDARYRFISDPNDGSKLIGDRSVMIDICSTENGNYFALDENRKRIFSYNREGYLLYAFGGKGTAVGNIQNPCAIEVRGDTLLVLDQVAASFTVFKKTEYAKLITSAENHYYNGEYEDSLAQWTKVLKVNSLFELAYLQLGKIYLHKGEDRKAMEAFRLGNYRGDKISYMTGYNRAFTEYRKDLMSDYLGVIVGGGVAMWLIAVAWRRIRSKRGLAPRQTPEFAEYPSP